MSDELPLNEALTLLRKATEQSAVTPWEWCKDCGERHMPPVPCGYVAKVWTSCECEALGVKHCGQCEG